MLWLAQSDWTHLKFNWRGFYSCWDGYGDNNVGISLVARAYCRYHRRLLSLRTHSAHTHTHSAAQFVKQYEFVCNISQTTESWSFLSHLHMISSFQPHISRSTNASTRARAHTHCRAVLCALLIALSMLKWTVTTFMCVRVCLGMWKKFMGKSPVKTISVLAHISHNRVEIVVVILHRHHFCDVNKKHLSKEEFHLTGFNISFVFVSSVHSIFNIFFSQWFSKFKRTNWIISIDTVYEMLLARIDEKPNNECNLIKLKIEFNAVCFFSAFFSAPYAVLSYILLNSNEFFTITQQHHK